MKPTVMLVEKIHPKYLKELERRTRVVRPEAFTEDALAALAAKEQIDGIVIRTKGCVSEKIIRASPRLRVVGRHGIGVDHIDIEAATRAGVWVVNTPGGSRVAVTEHTWAMILGLSKNLIGGDAAFRRLDYGFRERQKSFELRGKTLGVIGLGRIGTTVAEAAVKGFGMNVLYTDIVKYPKKESRLKARKAALKTLLAKSDVVTIHTPLDESTAGMMGREQFKLMQPHAFFINCARGAIMDAEALAEALETGVIAGAGVDVLIQEPPPPGHPLLKTNKVILSPHSAAQTPEANLAYAEVVLDVFRVFDGKRPQWPCNEVPL